MARKKPNNKVAEYEKALAEPDVQFYVLRLCISGMTPRSRRALLNLKKFCEQHLDGHYELEVIDLYQQPELAARHQVIATPTLLKDLPRPLRRMFGDLSDTRAALRRLGIILKKDPA